MGGGYRAGHRDAKTSDATESWSMFKIGGKVVTERSLRVSVLLFN